MRVLVTGGAGYIGSVVATHLVQAGHAVVVYDNLSRGHRTAVPAAAEFVLDEIANRPRLEEVLRSRSIEAVLHFAGLIEAGESMKVPEAFFRNNTAGTLALLEAMVAAGVGKLVFSSTAALYGEPERLPIRETDPLRPTNAYGESKLLVEQMLAWFHRIHGLRYASLRYFNAAGADGDLGEDHQPESHLIPRALEVALGKRASIPVFGYDYPTPDGTCVRDYIHVADLARAHLLALEALGRCGKLVYNLGNGRGFTVQQVLEAVRLVTGHPVPAVVSPRRPGDPPALVASAEKVQRELGWHPEHGDLETIVRSAWEWHRRHPRGYEGAAPTLAARSGWDQAAANAERHRVGAGGSAELAEDRGHVELDRPL
ncbi:MAG TPA: UDP-glucose 4-epimerase GalE [Terriglobales bacterium]|nr:UDP-glucose 4-epimerase GalE [Terriglobales bacterium]